MSNWKDIDLRISWISFQFHFDIVIIIYFDVFDGVSAYLSDYTDICMCVDTCMSKYGQVILCLL